ncbi:hypothetical protein BBJ28_00005616 [Nothophytophthora sp. Chile5]|nr:hypothetical protein BBJ28_00005616 [Nothophytophthora sp. Chile5]
MDLRDDQMHERAVSVVMEASWSLVDQCEMQQLTKLHAISPNVADIKRRGELREYDAAFDRTPRRTITRVHRYNRCDYYYVTTTDNLVMEKLSQQGDATVFGTDTTLALASANGVFYKTFDPPSLFAIEDAESASVASADGTAVYRLVLRRRATIGQYDQYDQQYLPDLRSQYAPQNMQNVLHFLDFYMEIVWNRV